MIQEEKATVTKAREVTAKRLQNENKEFTARVFAINRQLKVIFDHYVEKVTKAVEDKGNDTAKLKRINEILHDETVLLRSSLRICLNAAIRDSARMGYKHIGDALLPIFKHNREQIEQEVVAGRALFEAKLVFGLRKDFARRTTAVAVSLSSTKAVDDMGRIVKQVTKKTLAGLRPNDRIWELTTRAEADLKRVIANGMGNGDNVAVIARKIKRYVSPKIADNAKLGIENGPGIYRSPFKNAYRLARTEMNKTYVKAAVQFAKGKAWLQDGDILLSPLHSDYDECDELAAGGPYTPDQAEELIPAHPHCGCRYAPRIDPKYLGEEEPTNED